MTYRCPYCVDRGIRPCDHGVDNPYGTNGQPLPPPETYKEYSPDMTSKHRPNPWPIPEIDLSEMQEHKLS